MIHYLPFFIVGRVLYFHHYFPALFFAIFSINYVMKHFPLRFFNTFVIMSVLVYFYFSALTYGINGPAINLAKKKWIGTWDFL